jgi:hypothetical protein
MELEFCMFTAVLVIKKELHPSVNSYIVTEFSLRHFLAALNFTAAFKMRMALLCIYVQADHGHSILESTNCDIMQLKLSARRFFFMRAQQQTAPLNLHRANIINYRANAGRAHVHERI